MTYSLGLALFDFVPVFLTGVALWFLAQLVIRRAPDYSELAITGTLLVVLSGTLKATWKLIAATTGEEILLLSELMFPLMAPGFVLMAFAIWATLRHNAGKTVPAHLTRIALGIIVVVFAWATLRTIGQAIPRGYFFPFLLMASIANVGLSILLIGAAVRRRQWLIGLLFFVNIGMVFALQPIAAMPDKSIAIHWFEQTLTSGGAAAFALASWLFLRTITGSVRTSAPDALLVDDLDAPTFA